MQSPTAFTVVIPARFGSTRLPGKPLLDIGGKPMVQRVWEQASRSAADRVVIATDDERILAAARGFGAEALMTSPRHPSGTDRLREVAGQLDLPDGHVVVNVQGDEPMIPPAVVDQVAGNLHDHPGAGIATLCEAIESWDDLASPDVVKVVCDARGMALYFSRAIIPWPRDGGPQSSGRISGGQWQRHIGIYAYRTGFLKQFVGWPPAPQEQLESLEQLRALYNGVAIHVATACAAVPPGIDTERDLAAARRGFAGRS
jgi:3-deoxy-manno-octulosonate cytidylyltransferase (CMP-KDO synthetase)